MYASGLESEEGVGRFCAMLSADQATVVPSLITTPASGTEECV